MRRNATRPLSTFANRKQTSRNPRKVLATIQINLDSPVKPAKPKLDLFDSKRLTFAKQNKHFNENKRKPKNAKRLPLESKFKPKPNFQKDSPRRKPSCDNLIRKNIAKNLKSNVFKTGTFLLELINSD